MRVFDEHNGFSSRRYDTHCHSRHISPLFYPSRGSISASLLPSLTPRRRAFISQCATRDGPTLDSSVSYHSFFVPPLCVPSRAAGLSSLVVLLLLLFIDRRVYTCIYDRTQGAGRAFSAAPFCHRRRAVSL